MNSRLFLACLAAGIVSFILGFIVFGIAMADYFDASMYQYEGLERAEPNMVSLLIFNLAGGAMVGYVVWKSGV